MNLQKVKEVRVDLVVLVKPKKTCKDRGLYGLIVVFFKNLSKEYVMTRVCEVTGKKTVTGNNVSHANNRTRRRFLPNLQNRRFWVESENRWVSMRISGAALRTIDKLGIDAVIVKMRAEGKKV